MLNVLYWTTFIAMVVGGEGDKLVNEMTCNNCSKDYYIDSDQIRLMYEGIRGLQHGYNMELHGHTHDEKCLDQSS